ncbi:metallophosphoesterase [Candidatus Woesearchaeota archaeon]|nr:metallophosphoesterase [Candidatus Woesearchaeota archaeon]
MNLLPNIKIIGLTLYLVKQRILVLADSHIGYEEALNKQGILIPRLQFKEIMSNLEQVFKQVKPKLIIMLGDIKHEFGTISKQEWRDTLNLLDYLLEKAKVVLIKGNHDNILGPLAKKKNLEIKDYFAVDNVFLCHGHKLMDDNSELKKAETIIIGHEHPAITIRDDVRVEKYKCYLLGKYKKKNLIVMPSFNFVTEGTDVLQEKLLSPFLTNIDDFKAYILGDKIYDFGRVSKLK